MPFLEHKKNKNLKISYFDGICAATMQGFTQDYFIPFLVLLDAGARQVASLNALPNLFSALIQIKSADLTNHLKSRRGMVAFFALCQAMVLLGVCLLVFFKYITPGVFITAVILFSSFGALTNAPWNSLLSDLVPSHKRGGYFGWRNKNLGFVAVGASFTAGCILHVMRGLNIFWGFALIFALGFISRMLSWNFLNKIEDPPLVVVKEDHFTFFQFLQRFKHSNFAKFVMFVSLMSFSVHLAAPFFAVMMLRELHLSYFTFTLINAASLLTTNLSMTRWGRHADTLGNLKIIKFTAPLVGFIPFLWIINRDPLFLLLVQIAAGFLWAGFNLCTANFIYDAVTPGKRTCCIAYFNVLNGTAAALGALLGGFLLSYLPELLGYKILTLFLISSLFRIAVGVILPRFLKEVRPVEKVSSRQLFSSMIGIEPILSMLHGRPAVKDRH